MDKRVFLLTPPTGVCYAANLVNLPYRNLHERVMAAMIADPDPIYAEALRVVEHLQCWAIRTSTWAPHWKYLDGLTQDWRQVPTLPALIGEVLELIVTARRLPSNERRVSWVL